MTTFDLDNGKQVVIADGRLQLWANRGCLGVQLTPEQMQEIGLAMYQVGRRAKEWAAGPRRSGSAHRDVKPFEPLV